MATKNQKIEAKLRARINDQTYAPGTELPTQKELSEEFGAARETIRRAVNSLAAAGMIHLRPGQQPVVSSDGRLVMAANGDAITWPERAGNGATDRVVSAGREPAPAEVAFRLDVEPGTEVVQRVRHRLLGDVLIGVHMQWVSSEVAAAVRTTTGTDLSQVPDDPEDPGDVFQEFTDAGVAGEVGEDGNVDFTTTETHVATIPSLDEQAVFGIDRSVPLLVTFRVTNASDGTPLEYSRMPNRGDKDAPSGTYPVSRTPRRPS